MTVETFGIRARLDLPPQCILPTNVTTKYQSTSPKLMMGNSNRSRQFVAVEAKVERLGSFGSEDPGPSGSGAPGSVGFWLGGGFVSS